MAFVVADDKVEDFLKEKADKDKVKQIYKMAERFEKRHKPKPQSQADKIRAMSDEELAEFLTSIDKGYDTTYGDYFEASNGVFISSKVDVEAEVLQWLKSEVKE